jgi:hypothetical protein
VKLRVFILNIHPLTTSLIKIKENALFVTYTLFVENNNELLGSEFSHILLLDIFVGFHLKGFPLNHEEDSQDHDYFPLNIFTSQPYERLSLQILH